MSCCAAGTADTDRFFSRLAPFSRLRFRLFGFERSQKQLMAGVARSSLAGASILEVGCGAGHLHQALLQGSGADRATGVELSARMLEAARAAARSQGLSERTDYRHGDFVVLASSLPDADVTILDKVICCYPDADTLLARALERTRRICALTYPRDRRLTRVTAELQAKLLRVAGSTFRPYVHDPQRVERIIASYGFTKTYEAQTAVWLTEVYSRAAPAARESRPTP
ncbi:MAG: class I SAM-dependent methyltransferase [Gammaproteobacteria bacterium]|nr:class I SAM-dependent methyltransferase [Gammaproteobacteria bacterium]NIR85971.1 class I SAM-dependent methyltransferase [Gammaproteobacteria bacterium]NIR91962.1 class I SAM-dependent methyltransferase [Gammaproteobacteria bacterium]NIU07212.1 class I SAM-dependent methyltransferase [Gammaproteobacteria bacterium]NIV74213.1 methyltransferase domain-containing protein [Gammaproteobacteria bacterium]